RRDEASGSLATSAFSIASRCSTAAPIRSSLLPLLNEPRPALARTLVPSTPLLRQSAPSRSRSAADQAPPHAPPESPQARDSSAALRQPASGRQDRAAQAVQAAAPIPPPRSWRKATKPAAPPGRRAAVQAPLRAP